MGPALVKIVDLLQSVQGLGFLLHGGATVTISNLDGSAPDRSLLEESTRVSL